MKTPVTPAMLSQFEWLAMGVEAMEVWIPDEIGLRFAMVDFEDEDFEDEDCEVKCYEGALDPSMFLGVLPQLLIAAAAASANLKHMSLHWLDMCTGAVMESCACLTQITKLSLEYVELGPDTAAAQIQCLTNLQALKVRGLLGRQPTAKRRSIINRDRQQARFG